MRFRAATLLFCSVVGIAACGSRTSLRLGEGGGGAGGASSSVTSSVTATSSSTASGLPTCARFDLVAPVVALPTSAPSARAEEISLASDDDVDVVLSIIEAPQAVSGILRVGRLSAFAKWPPTFVGMFESAPSVVDYVTGDGAQGPVALLALDSGPLMLATTFIPQLVAMPQATPGDVPRFVTGIHDRFLYAASQDVSGQTHFDVGSYQTGSLEQSEGPTACVTSAPLGAVVPSGQGFVAAYALPNPNEGSCGMAMSPATVIGFYRYDAPTEQGSFLTTTEGDHLVFDEPLSKLVSSRTTNGAWAFYQTDGSTSFAPPGVYAARVDGEAHLQPVGSTGIQVVPDGKVIGAIAAASLGDGAAFAWVDSSDPSLPTVSVRSVAPDGTLGQVTSFSTSPVNLTGRLRLIASRNQRSLLVAWESDSGLTAVGLARLDCFLGT